MSASDIVFWRETLPNEFLRSMRRIEVIVSRYPNRPLKSFDEWHRSQPKRMFDAIEDHPRLAEPFI